MTESGKTTLARHLAHEYKRKGIGVIVLDPLRDPGWRADFCTDNPEQFLECFWGSESCAVFIDESGDAVGKYDLEMQQTATKGRHFGHNVHYITQRHAQLSATVRAQTRFLALFRSSLDDCKLHAREWARPELLEGANLNQGEYLFCGRFQPLQKRNIFTEINNEPGGESDNDRDKRSPSSVGGAETVDRGDETE